MINLAKLFVDPVSTKVRTFVSKTIKTTHLHQDHEHENILKKKKIFPFAD